MLDQEIAKHSMLLQECRIANRLWVLHQRPLQIGLRIEHFPELRDIGIAQRRTRLPKQRPKEKIAWMMPQAPDDLRVCA